MDLTLETASVPSIPSPPLGEADRHRVGAGRAITRPARASTARWVGRVLSGLTAAFLFVDGAGKLVQARPYVEGSVGLGYPVGTVAPIGIILLACLAVHLVPRTAVLGAVLLTGYLGGAVAANVRAGTPLLSHTLFPIYFAALLWLGLYLRDGRVRAVLAPRRGPTER